MILLNSLVSYSCNTMEYQYVEIMSRYWSDLQKYKVLMYYKYNLL